MRLVLTAVFPILCSDDITHVVSEDNQASSLWKWLRECTLKNLPDMHVLDVSWFTDSMREGRPVAVETRHLIQVCLSHKPDIFFFTVGRYRIYRVSTRWHYEPNGRLYIECGVTNKNDMQVQHLRKHNDLILLHAGNAYPLNPLPLNL